MIEGATVEKPKVKKSKPVPTSEPAPASVPSPASTAPSQPNTAATTEVPAVTSPEDAGRAAQTDVGVSAREVGSAVTVVSSAQLKAQQIRHAADALRSLPGVAVGQTSGPGSKTQIRIRGAEGNHTLVLIDGIDASAANDNEFDFSNLLADDIERIEVIRGGQSGIYGSKAIGGVVNIVTKGGKGPITLRARTEFGSYGTKDVSARASGGTDKAWLTVGAAYREQSGFNSAIYGTEDDPWDNATVNVKGGFTILPGMTLDFVARNTNKFTNTDPEGFLPQTGLNGAVDAPNFTKDKIFLGGVTLRWDMLDGALTHIAKANTTETDSESFSTGFFGGTAWNLSEAETYSYLATYRFSAPELLQSKHSISGFIENRTESFTPSSSRPPGPFTPDGLTREREYTAVVAEYRVGLYDRLFLGGTVRHDDNDSFTDFTTWNLNASLDVKELGIRPHASTGTSVALPGMFEQFGSVLGVFVGNPNLVPEESYSWDAGVEFTLLDGRAIVDITYFEADLTNEITGFGNTTLNQFGVSERKGIEISGRYAVSPSLTLGASYTYLDAGNPDGSEEVRRPPHTARADLNYSFSDGKGNFNLAAIYNGDAKDTNFATFPATIVTLDDYVLLNAAASYEVQPGFEVFGRVENILDEDYEEVSGYNTPGVAAYAGVRIKLEDSTTADWARYK
jgi:vitamin B12 transporter